MILVTRAPDGGLAFTLDPMASSLGPSGSTTAWRTIRAYVLARDHHTCQIGSEGCTGAATHVDHIVPRELGGGDEETNLRAACERCNLGRGRARVEHEPAPLRLSSW